MTALPADLLGEIIYYVDDLYTVNALALTCRAGAQFVRESADYIADLLTAYRPPDYTPSLPNGVKHGDVAIPLGFDSDTFTVIYCRGVIVSWHLCTDDGGIMRGHPNTHYVLIAAGSCDRYGSYVGVFDSAGAYHQTSIASIPYHGHRRRLTGYLIDDVIVPSVIESWAAVAMNITLPTRPYIVHCNTNEEAVELNKLGIVEAVWTD